MIRSFAIHIKKAFSSISTKVKKLEWNRLEAAEINIISICLSAAAIIISIIVVIMTILQ